MKTKIYKITILSAICFLTGFSAKLSYGQNVFINLGRERIALENELEQKAEEHLKRRFGLKKVLVRIEAVPYVSMEEVEQEEARSFVLPGVPMAEEVFSAREAPALRYFLNRMSVSVDIPEDFPDESIAQIRSFLTEMLNLDFDRGDRLDIERTLETSVYELEDIASSPHVYRIPILLFSFIFLLGPVRSYLKQARRKMETMTTGERGEVGAAGTGAVGVSGQPAGARETEATEKRKYFSFINRRNFTRLLYAIKNESVETIAVACEYLPGDLSARLLAQLPPEKKNETIKFMSRVNYLSSGRIKEIENNIREKVESLVGGDESIFKLFKELDIDEQKNMIEAAGEVNGELSERLNSYIITFADVLEFEAAQLIPVIRGTGISTLARALQGEDKETVANLIKKIPAGMARMLEEELSFLPELSEKQVYQARKEIMKRAYDVRVNQNR